jgi:hypothetical protein
MAVGLLEQGLYILDQLLLIELILGCLLCFVDVLEVG